MPGVLRSRATFRHDAITAIRSPELHQERCPPGESALTGITRSKESEGQRVASSTMMVTVLELEAHQFLDGG